MRKVFTAISLVLVASQSGCGVDTSTIAGPPPSNAAWASPRPEMECRSQSIGTVDATSVTGEKTLDQLGSLYSKPDEAMSSFEEEDGTGTVYIGPATDAPATVVIRATRSSDGWVVDSISRCS